MAKNSSREIASAQQSGLPTNRQIRKEEALEPVPQPLPFDPVSQNQTRQERAHLPRQIPVLPRGYQFGPGLKKRAVQSDNLERPTTHVGFLSLPAQRPEEFWSLVEYDLLSETFFQPKPELSAQEILDGIEAECATRYAKQDWVCVIAAPVPAAIASQARDKFGKAYGLSLVHILDIFYRDTGLRIVVMEVDPLLPHEVLAESFAKEMISSIEATIRASVPDFNGRRVVNRGGAEITIEDNQRLYTIKEKSSDWSINITKCQHCKLPRIYGEAGFSQSFTSVLSNLADAIEGTDLKIAFGASIQTTKTDSGWSQPLLAAVAISRTAENKICISGPYFFGHDVVEDATLGVKASYLVEGDQPLEHALAEVWCPIALEEVGDLVYDGLDSDEPGLSTDYEEARSYKQRAEQAYQDLCTNREDFAREANLPQDSLLLKRLEDCYLLLMRHIVLIHPKLKFTLSALTCHYFTVARHEWLPALTTLACLLISIASQ